MIGRLDSAYHYYSFKKITNEDLGAASWLVEVVSAPYQVSIPDINQAGSAGTAQLRNVKMTCKRISGSNIPKIEILGSMIDFLLTTVAAGTPVTFTNTGNLRQNLTYIHLTDSFFANGFGAEEASYAPVYCGLNNSTAWDLVIQSKAAISTAQSVYCNLKGVIDFNSSATRNLHI
jgi:hypothetical protein